MKAFIENCHHFKPFPFNWVPQRVGTFDNAITSGQPNVTTSGMDQMISFLGQKFDSLSAAIMQLAETPRSLSFTSQQPVDDYAAWQNKQTANSLKNLPG